MKARLSSEDKAYLEKYSPKKYDNPSVALDIIIFTIIEQQLHVLLIKRKESPFKGAWAFPGGFIDKQRDCDLEAAARRELWEETGVEAAYLEQLKTYGSKQRDPRNWTLSIAYFALLSSEALELHAGTDAADARWVPIKENSVSLRLAFDHDDILQDAVSRLRGKVEYTSIGVHLLEKEFTLSRLQATYEIILGSKLDKSSFRTRIKKSGVIIPTGKMHEGFGRPAELYCFASDDEAHEFFPRSYVWAHKKR